MIIAIVVAGSAIVYVALIFLYRWLFHALDHYK
jgi:putative solute:sodium symporter small subunit